MYDVRGEVNFLLPLMLDGMDRPSRLGLLDRQTNLAENPDIGQMINHT